MGAKRGKNNSAKRAQRIYSRPKEKKSKIRLHWLVPVASPPHASSKRHPPQRKVLRISPRAHGSTKFTILNPSKNALGSPFMRINETTGQRRKILQSAALLTIGITLVVLSAMIRASKPAVQLSTSFTQEPVKIDSRLITGPSSNTPERIIIPQTKIDIPISVSPIINGYWKVYEDRAGYGIGSGIPGESGNVVIFAHAREGLFLPLKEIKTGDLVYLLTSGSYLSYKVKNIKEVLPNQTEVISPTLNQTLTLYTCSGFLDKERLIVIAEPI